MVKTVRQLDEVINILRGLYRLTENGKYKFGIAGSFSRGEQREDSDVDIIISGDIMLTADEYYDITDYLEISLNCGYDLLNIEALEIEDKKYDEMLVEMGLGINVDSAYKNIKKDVIWIEQEL